MKTIARMAVFAAAAMLFVPPASADAYQDRLSELRTRFKASDRNKDGKLTRQEARDGGMVRIADNFSVIDADKDGVVTLAQIEAQMAARFR